MHRTGKSQAIAAMAMAMAMAAMEQIGAFMIEAVDEVPVKRRKPEARPRPEPPRRIRKKSHSLECLLKNKGRR